MQTISKSGLTRQRPLYNLLKLSFPLMLMVSSGTFMLFGDRLILARFSVMDMPAVAMAGMLYSVFVYGLIGITSMSEVVVGNFNGSGELHKLGRPVWQMLWFSIAAYLLFIPLGLWAGQYLMPSHFQTVGIPYFKTLMLFGPIQAMSPAIGGFFIGQGKTKTLLLVSIVTNIFNLLANIVLVFGYKDWIPSLGIQGSALATGLAHVVSFVLLSGAFLSKSNRRDHRSHDIRFDLPILTQSLKIGIPNTISHIVEISGWLVQSWIISNCEAVLVTALSIGNSIFLLFTFANEGLSKGIIAIGANCFGSRDWKQLHEVLKASIKLSLLAGIILTIPFVIAPSFLANLFIKYEATYSVELFEAVRLILRLVWLFCLCDLIAWSLSSILTSAGDTRFIMFVNSFSVWVCAVLPSYWYIHVYKGSPIYSWIFGITYALVNSILFYLRYRSKKWLPKVNEYETICT